MNIFNKFKLGLSKSSKNFSSGLKNLIFKRKIDEGMLNELEDFLIQSDVGVESAKELRDKFANIKIDPKTSEKEEIFKIFSNYISEILKPLEKNVENIREISLKMKNNEKKLIKKKVESLSYLNPTVVTEV